MPIDHQVVWQLQFATRLHHLCPTIAGATAARLAVEAYRDGTDLNPDAAAENYAREHGLNGDDAPN